MFSLYSLVLSKIQVVASWLVKLALYEAFDAGVATLAFDYVPLDNLCAGT